MIPPLNLITVAPGVPEPRPTPLAGDVTGSTLASTVVKVEGNLFEPVTYGALQDGYALTWVNGSAEWQAKPTAISFTAGGDLSGSNVNQNVIKLQGNSVISGILGAQQDGYALTWTNSSNKWQPKPIPSIYDNLLIFNVKAYGAVGNGIVDDTVAIQAAIAALKATYNATDAASGKLYFPKGAYLCSSPIDFHTQTATPTGYFPGVTICGDGGSVGGAEDAVSSIIYTADGYNTFIDARSAIGFTVEDIAIFYTSSIFYGKLLDFSHGPLGNDATNCVVRNVTFRDRQRLLVNASHCISLDRGINFLIDNCFFGHAQVGVLGQDAGYCNVATIRNCSFANLPIAAIMNPGESWTVEKNTFEGIPSGGDVNDINSNPTKRLRRAIYSNSAYVSETFRFIGNWCGDINEDVYTSPVPWVDPGVSGGFRNAVFESNLFSNVGTDPLKVKDSIMLGLSDNVVIQGNDIDTVNFTSSSKQNNITISGNTIFKGFPGYDYANLDFKDVNIHSNSMTGQGFINGRGILTVGGHIVTRPGGSNVVTATCNANATIDISVANDTSGFLYLTVNTTINSLAPQPLIDVTFAYPFDTAHGNPIGYLPKIFLQPVNELAANAGNYVYTPIAYMAGTGFRVSTAIALPPGLYVWAYLVIQ